MDTGLMEIIGIILMFIGVLGSVYALQLWAKQVLKLLTEIVEKIGNIEIYSRDDLVDKAVKRMLKEHPEIEDHFMHKT